MSTQVKVGGAWHDVTALRVKGADQGAHLVRALYQYQRRLKDGSLTEYETVWVKIAEYSPPWLTVPGVSLSQGSEVLGPTTYIVGWTIATSTGAAAYAWNIRVDWYKAGVFQVSDIVPQSAGGKQRTYNAQDQIYAIVGYVSAQGSGATVQTPTV